MPEELTPRFREPRKPTEAEIIAEIMTSIASDDLGGFKFSFTSAGWRVRYSLLVPILKQIDPAISPRIFNHMRPTLEFIRDFDKVHYRRSIRRIDEFTKAMGGVGTGLVIYLLIINSHNAAAGMLLKRFKPGKDSIVWDELSEMLREYDPASDPQFLSVEEAESFLRGETQ